MKVLNTQYGGPLKAEDLNSLAKATLSQSLALGKGVISGMEVAPDTGLSLRVQPGDFRAQVPDELQQAQTIPVEANYEGYLWVEANSNPEDVPNFDIQGTDSDRGSNWVCLGHFVSTDSSVTYDESGRTIYGWRANQAAMPNIQAEIQAAQPKWCAETTEDGISGTIDGTNKTFALSFPPIPGSLRLEVSGFTPGRYTVDGTELEFNVAPPSGATITAQYSYN